jgi:hypothetical protein
MEKWTFDQAATKADLISFFENQRTNLRSFGSTVNQTFEAFVFASVVQWYRDNGWSVTMVNPRNPLTKKVEFRLKFSTRGEPKNFSYAIAIKDGMAIQIRHQLRVATTAHEDGSGSYANICLDVAVIEDTNLSKYKTFSAVPNKTLISFGEAKHMSAFAELLAGFIGMVYELQPSRLKKIRKSRSPRKKPDQLAPFLFVSGLLYNTAKGIEATFVRRGFDIDVYSSVRSLSIGFSKISKQSGHSAIKDK